MLLIGGGKWWLQQADPCQPLTVCLVQLPLIMASVWSLEMFEILPI